MMINNIRIQTNNKETQQIPQETQQQHIKSTPKQRPGRKTQQHTNTQKHTTIKPITTEQTQTTPRKINTTTYKQQTNNNNKKQRTKMNNNTTPRKTHNHNIQKHKQRTTQPTHTNKT